MVYARVAKMTHHCYYTLIFIATTRMPCTQLQFDIYTTFGLQISTKYYTVFLLQERVMQR